VTLAVQIALLVVSVVIAFSLGATAQWWFDRRSERRQAEQAELNERYRQ
jgi:type II secretory pathway pseudopilin PulG